ncbi:MAG: efflux RND transporter periplasmic adaptor subunit [Proteobacteria bacterium]|nr:efflux RND transporter periplasmic adaptor subunit [Pseudomonadota bacterium]
MPTRPPFRALLIPALAALALAPLSACGSKPDAAAEKAEVTPQNLTLTSAQLQHVRVVEVAPADFHKALEVAGVVDFDNDQSTSVVSPISGLVTRLLVQPNQQVAAGQALAMVDSSDFAAATSAYAKALATARTTRRIADADKDLAQGNGVSAREAQQAETDAANAAADRDAALQALQALKIDPKAIRDIEAGKPVGRIEGAIRAPIAGTLVEKLITPGQLLQAGTTPAFTVANLSKVWVMAQIPGAELTSVHVGDAAEIEAGDGTAKMTGVVDSVSAVVNPDTRAVIARVVVANPGGLLKKQMYVRVRIRAQAASRGITAPVSAILRDDENLPFVYVALNGAGQNGEAFARRRVTLGERSGDQYAIAGGLNPGDRIVADGAIFMQFMQSQ